MRDDEKSGLFKLSSASYMALGFFLSALFFSKGLAITSWFILAISDCIAALVGMRFGTPTRYGKSFAGSIAFFTSAVLISTACYFFIGYQTSFFTILISSAITSGLEFYSKHIDIDDNILIPLAYCFVTSVFVFISSL
jgi:dolichol kinase